MSEQKPHYGSMTNSSETTQTQKKIEAVGREVVDLLIEKNQSYGDPALNPAGIFASGNAVDNLCSRIDDKLMRIKTQGFRGYGEDNVKDLIGYLILLKIALEDDAPTLQDWQNEILGKQGYFQSRT